MLCKYALKSDHQFAVFTIKIISIANYAYILSVKRSVSSSSWQLTISVTIINCYRCPSHELRGNLRRAFKSMLLLKSKYTKNVHMQIEKMDNGEAPLMKSFNHIYHI